MTSAELEQVRAEFEAQGYHDLKIIDGKLCGTYDYLTTRGIVVGLNAIHVEYRYCYQDRWEASRAFTAYTSLVDHPTGNWIKLKGVRNGEYMDYLNPEWSRA